MMSELERESEEKLAQAREDLVKINLHGSSLPGRLNQIIGPLLHP